MARTSQRSPCSSGRNPELTGSTHTRHPRTNEALQPNTGLRTLPCCTQDSAWTDSQCARAARRQRKSGDTANGLACTKAVRRARRSYRWTRWLR